MVEVKLSTTTVSWRSIEKLLSYGAALVASTNGFAQLSLPTSLRDSLLGVAAIVVAALHVSGPAATANTSTSPTPVVTVPAAVVSRAN